jgi:hypothetical protein
LQARGPATVDDLVHWTKLTKGDCRAAFEANEDITVEVGGPGGPYRMLTEHLDALDPGSRGVDRSVRALAAFDEHLLGYRIRDAVLDPDYASLVDPGRNGVFRWTIVVGGRVVATWKRIRRTHHTIGRSQIGHGSKGRRSRCESPSVGSWRATPPDARSRSSDRHLVGPGATRR